MIERDAVASLRPRPCGPPLRGRAAPRTNFVDPKPRRKENPNHVGENRRHRTAKWEISVKVNFFAYEGSGVSDLGLLDPRSSHAQNR